MACERVSLDPPIVEAAQSYISAGWVPIRIHAGTKQPIGKEWQMHPPTPDQFHEGDGIGVLVGSSGNYRTDVDLDCENALQLAPEFLPATGCVSGRNSNPRSHHWYVCDPAPPYKSFSDTNGEKLLELRSGFGQQTVVPPSLHPSNEPYIWHEQSAPAIVDPATLQQGCRRLAAAVLLVRHYPSEGSRHDFALALSGLLLRNAWTLAETVHFIIEVARAANDAELKDREDCARTTLESLEASQPATGGPSLRQIIGRDVLDKLSDWLGLGAQLPPVHEDDWPELLQIADPLLPVDPFELEFLPASIRGLVADLSERMQVPPDFAGATATVALAACCNRRAIMFPKEKDSGWSLPLNLWAALVGAPGTLKSPLIGAITKPLKNIEGQWRNEYATALAAYESVHEQQELTRQNQREQYKKALKSDCDSAEPFSLVAESKPPIQKRLLVTDSTFEALHTILAGNAAGVTVVRDELVGWIGSLDRRGRESERAFFLQAWNGDGDFTVDRIGRGSVHVEACCVSLLGPLQPSRIRQYFSDSVANNDGPQNDGLFQRFQIMVWPNISADWKHVDREPDAQALTTAERIFSRLANLSPSNPVRLGFDPEAQESFVSWWTDLENTIRTSDWPPAMIAHLAKYRGLLPRLAALFELADAAARHDFNPGPGIVRVGLSHLEQAIRYTNYLWSHAKRVYDSCHGAADSAAGRKLAKQISSGKLPATISVREIYRHHWYGLESPEKVRTALCHLADLGWVREVKSDREKGRPTEMWEINPRCRKEGAE
jgi:Protein of unknown function (DUF3987)/Bifunctional DNA primase/polymerase, N-terminal